jgi:signal peptidase II
VRSIAGPLTIAAAIVLVDQWTKGWASHALQNRAPMRVLDDVVRLTYTRNSGVAFGLGAGSHFPYWIFSLVAAVAILALLITRPDRPPVKRLALALVLGGAIGNLIDRVRFGEVVDFILLSWQRWQFPVFNVADSAVSIGVAVFALAWSSAPKPATDAEPSPTP